MSDELVRQDQQASAANEPGSVEAIANPDTDTLPGEAAAAEPVKSLRLKELRIIGSQQGEMPFAVVQGEAVTEIPQDLYIPPDALEVFLEAFEGGEDRFAPGLKKIRAAGRSERHSELTSTIGAKPSV